MFDPFFNQLLHRQHAVYHGSLLQQSPIVLALPPELAVCIRCYNLDKRNSNNYGHTSISTSKKGGKEIKSGSDASNMALLVIMGKYNDMKHMVRDGS